MTTTMTEVDADIMVDEEGNSIFAFQDLDYVPFGFSSTTAPYIETPIATMRAAATLMHLDSSPDPSSPKPQKGEKAQIVVCDLGCGDGELLLSLLRHINTTPSFSTVIATSSNKRLAATGVGIDYDAELIKTAGLESKKQAISSQWLIYDFNADLDDIAGQLLDVHKITHVFVGLVPKQLALPTVRSILTRLCAGGVTVCCYKYHPLYLRPARRDVLMNLVVYDQTSWREEGV